MFVALVLMLAVSSSADADAAYMQHHYKEAAALYSALVKQDATNAQAWYRLGVSDATLGLNADAANALNRALALGFDAMSVHYRLAGVAAAQGDANGAVAELNAAFKARPYDPADLADDKTFDSVRSQPVFTSMVQTQDKWLHPCRYDTAYHALDYWIGDWNVTIGGNAAGTSHIERAADQCAIFERWHGVYGAPGGSISTYDSSGKKWVQHYVDGRGTVTDYDGQVLADGSLQFVAGTGTSRTRMTFTHLGDGEVRQRFETSSDGGKTWSKPNDLLYHRAGPG